MTLFFIKRRRGIQRQILCQADDSHEISSLIFFEKYGKRKKKSKCHLLQSMIRTLRVNVFVGCSALVKSVLLFLFFLLLEGKGGGVVSNGFSILVFCINKNNSSNKFSANKHFEILFLFFPEK